MFTNEIISYDLSLHPNLKQITNMLTQVYEKFPILEGLIMHSDQGWQYQMEHYHKRLKERGILQSMSRKGNCYDNSVMETFFGRLKNEVYYGYENEYNSFEEFSTAIKEYRKNKMDATCFVQISIHGIIFLKLNFSVSRKLSTHQLCDK